MFLCPVTFSTDVAATKPTLHEQTLLELQYDGPIPPHALADLRRMPPCPVPLSTLTDLALGGWLLLAQRNLKAEQRRLADARKLKCAAHKRWRLKQCLDARAELSPLATEHARRNHSKRNY